MSDDDISIALEYFDVKEVDMSRVARAVRQINNVGFCVEHYHAIESAFPGTFKDINVKKLTKQPSDNCRGIAMEAVNMAGIGKIVGSAIVGGGIGYVVGKLINWIAERFSGGSGGGSGGNLRIDDRKMKETIAELKRVEREIVKIDPKAIDAAIEEAMADIDEIIKANSKQAKVTAISVKPKDASVRDVEEAIKNASNNFDPMIDVALYSPSGVKGVISFKEHPKYSVISKIEYVSLARTLQEVFKLIIDGISSDNTKTQKTNLEKVKKLIGVYTKHTDGFDEALAELKEHSLNTYSNYFRWKPQEFHDPSKGYLSKVKLDDRWFKVNEEVCENIRKHMKGISQTSYNKLKKDTEITDEEIKRGYDQAMKEVGKLTRYTAAVLQLDEGAIRQYNRIVRISEKSANKVVDILKYQDKGTG